MPSYKPTLLATLRDRRLDHERQTERTLAAAHAARRNAEAEAVRLEADLARAQMSQQNARRTPLSDEIESAAIAQARRRFWSRLEAEKQAALRALELHRKGPLEESLRNDTAARAAHLLARQRREVVDKAIARREAARRVERDRRAEAELDDRPGRPKSEPK